MEWISDYRKAIGGSAVLSGLIVAVINYSQGDNLVATMILAGVMVAAAALIWWTRPDNGEPHISHLSAQAAANDGDVIVYWRPG